LDSGTEDHSPGAVAAEAAPQIVDTPNPEAEIRKELVDFEGKILQRLGEFETSSLKQQERTARRETIVAWATGVIAVATFAYGIMSYLQWNELQNANARTDNLIQLGINNLRFANNSANVARHDTDNMFNVTTSEAESLETLASTNKELLRVNEEPILTHQGVKSTRKDGSLYTGEKVPVFVYFKNTGRGTAYDVHLWTESAQGPTTLPTIVEMKGKRQEPLTIGPGDDLVLCRDWSSFQHRH
jgi:hypothetical protein